MSRSYPYNYTVEEGEALLEEILNLHRRGSSIEKIAKNLGVHASCVYLWRKNGLVPIHAPIENYKIKLNKFIEEEKMGRMIYTTDKENNVVELNIENNSVEKIMMEFISKRHMVLEEKAKVKEMLEKCEREDLALEEAIKSLRNIIDLKLTS